jgi:hypothetical protein
VTVKGGEVVDNEGLVDTNGRHDREWRSALSELLTKSLNKNSPMSGLRFESQ